VEDIGVILCDVAPITPPQGEREMREDAGLAKLWRKIVL
jgi:hypothetical protein